MESKISALLSSDCILEEEVEMPVVRRADNDDTTFTWEEPELSGFL